MNEKLNRAEKAEETEVAQGSWNDLSQVIFAGEDDIPISPEQISEQPSAEDMKNSLRSARVCYKVAGFRQPPGQPLDPGEQEHRLIAKAETTRRYLDQPNCVEDLMKETGESLEFTVVDMFMTDPGQTIGHFEHISSMLEDVFGAEADQAAYNIFQYTAEAEDEMRMDNKKKFCYLSIFEKISFDGIFQLPGAKDLGAMLEIAKTKNLEIDQKLLQKYLKEAAESPDSSDQIDLMGKIDLLQAHGIRPSAVVRKLCEAAKFDTIQEQANKFSKYGLNVGMILDDFVDNCISSPHDLPFTVMKHPEAFQDYGVDLKQVLENNIPQVYDVEFFQDNRILKELSIDIDQLKLDSKDFAIERGRGIQEDMEGVFVSWKNLPEDVSREWRKSAANLSEREDSGRINSLLKRFSPEQWDMLDFSAKEELIQEYAAALADDYHLGIPYQVRIAPDDSLNTNSRESDKKSSTRGDQRIRWRLARDPEMQQYANKMRQAGIETTWLPYSAIRINESYLDEADEIVATVAHELRHSFQAEQEFLYRQGYYKQESPQGDFEYLPRLAQYFAANLQGQNYCKAKDSINDYSEQFVEADAVVLGRQYNKKFKGLI